MEDNVMEIEKVGDVYITPIKPMEQSRLLCDGWRDARKENPSKSGYFLAYIGDQRYKNYAQYCVRSFSKNTYNYGDTWDISRDEILLAWRELPAPPAFA